MHGMIFPLDIDLNKKTKFWVHDFKLHIRAQSDSQIPQGKLRIEIFDMFIRKFTNICNL